MGANKRIEGQPSFTQGAIVASKNIIRKAGLPLRKHPNRITICIIVASVLATMCAIESVAQRQRDRDLTHPNAPNTSTGRRVALVIGNADYRNASPLRNPVNDAQDMRIILRSYGFELLGKDNCSLSEMKQLILDFSRRLNGGEDVGLFYYAGHGIQVDGRNYLIPVEANIQSEQQVEFEAIDVGRVINEMNAVGNAINIVILDACRKNPFARSWRRSAADGLAPLDPPRGMLIAFATLPNRVADDGVGRNGVFTSELLKQLRTPGLELEEMFRRVRKSVDETSGRQQIPLVTSTIIGDFYFIRDVKSTDNLPTVGEVYMPLTMPKGTSLPAGNIRQFSYQTVRTNNQGNVLTRSQKHANGYIESVNGMSLDMVEIPGGTFMMGTGEGEKEQIIREYTRNIIEADSSQSQRAQAREMALGWIKKEMPQHAVRVKSFFIGRYEVTQAQWRAVGRLPRVSIDMNVNPSLSEGDNLPVENIGWDEAVEFCQRLSRATGREYRLPSEAEWEYAARGGRATQFPLGDTITTDLVNFLGGAPFGDAAAGVFRGSTTPVGSLNVANEFGLYDVSGNVWEWCVDYWHDSYAGAPADGTPWLINKSSNDHVVRGGAWNDPASYCRSASRGRDAEYRRTTERYGFRVAATAR